MLDRKVETICIFIFNENRFLCDRLNKCLLSPCDIFSECDSNHNREKYCNKLKKEDVETLLNGFLNDLTSSKTYCDQYAKQCQNGRMISVVSDFGVVDYFEKHKDFEKKLRDEMGPLACDLLENGDSTSSDFNCKYLRLCLIGLYLINQKKLNDVEGTIDYERLAQNFLYVMVPFHKNFDSVIIKGFYDEFVTNYNDCFNANRYSSELGKLICDAVNCYIDVLKDELKVVFVSSDIRGYIKERKKNLGF